MPALPSTDRAIRSLEPPTDKPQEIYWDDKAGGLILVVGKRTKTWMLTYRQNGRQRRVALGRYPDVGLAAARKEAERARGAILEGADPQQERIEHRKAETVAELLPAYMEAVKRNNRSWIDTNRVFNFDILPAIGHMKTVDVTRKDIANIIDRPLRRGAPVMANRTLEHVRTFFRWLEDQGHIEETPAARVRKPTKERPRERALLDEEIKALWLKTADLSKQARIAVRLVLLSGRRAMEIVGARWAEFDMQERIWRLPSDRNKTGREWRFPLTEPMVTLLDEARALHPDSPTVFVGTRMRGREPLPTHNLITQSLIRHDAQSSFAEHWTVHDLRRTCRTGLSRLGVQPHIAELCLGHTIGGIQGIYDVYTYLPEMRDAFTRWNSFVLELVGEKPTHQADVVALLRA